MDAELIRELNAVLWKVLVVSIPSFIVSLLFAVAVLRDANEQKRAGGRTILVGPKLWAFATLLGGVFVAAAYWLMHHSSLRRRQTEEVHPEREWA